MAGVLPPNMWWVFQWRWYFESRPALETPGWKVLEPNVDTEGGAGPFWNSCCWWASEQRGSEPDNPFRRAEKSQRSRAINQLTTTWANVRTGRRNRNDQPRNTTNTVGVRVKGGGLTVTQCRPDRTGSAPSKKKTKLDVKTKTQKRKKVTVTKKPRWHQTGGGRGQHETKTGNVQWHSNTGSKPSK